MTEGWLKAPRVETQRKGLMRKVSKRSNRLALAMPGHVACGRRTGWISSFWHERVDGSAIKLGKGRRSWDEK